MNETYENLPKPQSRAEEYAKKIVEKLTGTTDPESEYDKLPPPQSRIEVYLKKIVEEMGGVNPEQVEEIIKTYLEEHPLETDATLSVSGKAADSKATGEALDRLWSYIKATSSPSTWEKVEEACTLGIQRDIFKVGDLFSSIWEDTNNANKEYNNPLRINHFQDGVELEDGSTINGMFLQQKYAALKAIQFSHNQAFYVAGEDGLPAGTYCIQFGYAWGKNVIKDDYWNFTITKDVPAGGKIAGFYGAPDKLSTTWKVYVYSADGKTMLETISSVASGNAGTLLGVFSAYGDDVLNGLQATAYGNNRYATSAYRQYLNSDLPKGEWWSAQNKWDIAPDQLNQVDGFLRGFDKDLLAHLKPIKTITYCNTVTSEGNAQIKDITYDKVFLPSLVQMHIKPQIADEGETHEYYKELSAEEFPWYQALDLLKTYGIENHANSQYVRLRSASRGFACYAWNVYSTGNVSSNYATYAYRSAPLMFIGAAPSEAISAPTDAEMEDK